MMTNRQVIQYFDSFLKIRTSSTSSSMGLGWQHHYLLAPVSWLATVVLLLIQPHRLFNQSDPEPSLPKLNRRQTRRMQKLTTRAMKGTKRPPSIRTDGLHKKYPLKLRSKGHFVNHRPLTLTERAAMREDKRRREAAVDAVRRSKQEWQQEYCDVCQRWSYNRHKMQREERAEREAKVRGRRYEGGPGHTVRPRRKPNRQHLALPCQPYLPKWAARRNGLEVEAAGRLANAVHLFCTISSPEGASKKDLLRLAMGAPQKFRHSLPKEA